MSPTTILTSVCVCGSDGERDMRRWGVPRVGGYRVAWTGPYIQVTEIQVTEIQVTEILEPRA